ncbi:hypothetical protein CL1_1066 [Thermococcus cleftensis]|uniref:Uncharacterized protein n=1 Tax=Thermococcus cleftensis (strain DSM 27260 / KACC 17922 / CL1) TaxID=163003 RepID=I3ZU85_THECF|nr:hypothetical protein [Thermococcus cleftensis]AFL95269.1 hypothetical protein CL1_1066 [Thermococcus cleftensis]
MPDFDPKGFKLVGDYLSSLNEDSGTPPRDAINRTAVGRYYYSAFLQLREVLKKGLEKYPKSLRDKDFNDFIVALEGKNSHATIIAFFEALKEEINDVRIRQAHNSMVYLRALRNAADYDLREKPEIKTPKSPEKVNFSSKAYVQKAQRKYSFVENLLEDDSGDKLGDIIRVHKNTVANCIKKAL